MGKQTAVPRPFPRLYGTRLRGAYPAGVFFLYLAAPLGLGAQETYPVTGRVVDDESGDPVISAMIRVGQSADFGISGPEGRFRIDLAEASIPTLVVTAPGFAKRYHPVKPGDSGEIEIRLSADPLELEGFDVELQNIRTHLKRRRNRPDVPLNYALEGELLRASKAGNVWDLVGDRHNFHFDGFTDYGCPQARIFEGLTTVSLFVDELPVRIGIFQEYRPQDFALVEVYAFGAAIHAYTQQYLTWMTENSFLPPAFETQAGLCPAEKPAPGTMKRGRPVGGNPGP